MADIYVIFGAAVRPDGSPSGTIRRRVEGAFRLGGTDPGTVYLPTGGQGRHGPPEALVMRDLLVDLGAEPGQVLIDDAAGDTLDSILNCRAIIRRADPAARVHVCTSPYHMFRCRVLFRLGGVDARATEMPGDRAALGLAKFAYYWFREIPATLWDALLISTVRR